MDKNTMEKVYICFDSTIVNLTFVILFDNFELIMTCIWMQRAYFQQKNNSEPLQIYPLPYIRRQP